MLNLNLMKIIFKLIFIFFSFSAIAEEKFETDLIYLCGPDVSVPKEAGMFWSLGMEPSDFPEGIFAFQYYYFIIDLNENLEWDKLIVQNYESNEQYPNYFKSRIEHTYISNGMENYSEFSYGEFISIDVISEYREYGQVKNIKSFTLDKEISMYKQKNTSVYPDGEVTHNSEAKGFCMLYFTDGEKQI